MKLKPCPFCGERRGAPTKRFPLVWVVVCRNCNTEGPPRPNEARAIKAWETRKGPRGGIKSRPHISDRDSTNVK